MAKVTIDNITIDVPDGTTILQAARLIGKNVAPPTMCYYSKLKTSGGYCRTCLVKVSKGSEKDPRPMPKLVASCRTTVMDGMEVQNTTSPEVTEARKGVVEFLLLNHPLDCPVCDQAGECHLQDLSFEHGSEATRFEFNRRTYDQNNVGDYIQLHMNRCIHCYRCVKVAQEVCETRVHGMMNRGDHSEISTYVEASINHGYSGNMIDVCPVGALTDKTFRFKSRVWFTKPVEAHRNCSKCCGQVRLWFKGSEVLRVTGRKDQWGEVKDWICNECRFEKKELSDWVIEKAAPIDRTSVISANKYSNPELLRLNEEVKLMKHEGKKVQLGQGPLDPNNFMYKKGNK